MEEYMPENNQDWEKHWMVRHLLCQILKLTKMFTSIQVSVGTEMTTMLWNKIIQSKHYSDYKRCFPVVIWHHRMLSEKKDEKIELEAHRKDEENEEEVL